MPLKLSHPILMKLRACVICFLAFAPFQVFAVPSDEVIQLRNFEVTATMVPIMIPYVQLLRIDDILRSTSEKLRILGFTVRKHSNSRCPLPPLCLIRSADYKRIYEPPGEPNLCPLDAKYADYYASSNQPNDFADLFLIIDTGVRDNGIYLRDMKSLLDDYYAFVEKRLLEAVVHYKAKDRKEFRNAEKYILPDEIVIIAKKESDAVTIAGRVGVVSDGRSVRLSRTKLDSLVSAKGPDYLVANASEIENLAPWRSAEPSLPIKQYGGTLYLIGWLHYRKTIFSDTHWDFVIPEIQNIR